MPKNKFYGKLKIIGKPNYNQISAIWYSKDKELSLIEGDLAAVQSLEYLNYCQETGDEITEERFFDIIEGQQIFEISRKILRKKYGSDRNFFILVAYSTGSYTYAELADILKISVERVRQIYYKCAYSIRLRLLSSRMI